VLSSNANTVVNLGEYQYFFLEPNPPAIDKDGDATGFAVPIELEEMSDHELAERWALAKHQHTRQQLTRNDEDDAKQYRRNMCAGH
jgi:hypothetical protein